MKCRRPVPSADGLVPLKALRHAKTRLQAQLPAAARAALMAAMVRDVVAALRASGRIRRITLVGLGVAVRRLARRLGCVHLPECAGRSLGPDAAERQLNATVDGALRCLQRRRVRNVLLAHGDLPLLSPGLVRRCLHAHGGKTAAVTLVPALARGGTSLLALRPPTVIRPTFGAASAARHAVACANAGVDLRRLAPDDGARDIDTPADLAWLRQPDVRAKAGRHTRRWLATHGQASLAQGLQRLHEEPAAVLDESQAQALAECSDLTLLSRLARARRDQGSGPLVTWSPKVFLPLTQLCRDVCHYCTFAQSPSRLAQPYLSADDVLATVRAGQKLGCAEALFTLGDRPESRWPQAQDALAALGFRSTLDYLEHVAGRVIAETGMLPHINAGVLSDEEIVRLRPVSASMGLMLECVSERLCEPGMPHHGSPDKHPARRLATLEAAGRARVPFTSGLLIGIGETRGERIETLLALRASHRRHGHLQEVIVQDFHPKAGTKMAGVAATSIDDLCWTIAVARLILPLNVAVQAPPNLNPAHLRALLDAGINDFGGVSPLTRDYVNPEAPWPAVKTLQEACAEAGLELQARLTAHPRFVRDAGTWMHAAVAPGVRRLADADGLLRAESWLTGQPEAPPLAWRAPLLEARARARPITARPGLAALLQRASHGERLGETELTALFQARGDDVLAVCDAADALKRTLHGCRVSYVVTRNINYTNRCTYGCTFCAFSKPAHTGAAKGPAPADPPYNLGLDEIALRAEQAWVRGATEVCLQGGIHPKFDGHTYLRIADAVREAVPAMHIHAFSPLEVWHGARTLGLPLTAYLKRLSGAGLRSLPGTAAEILDDEVRAVLCPDKIGTTQWLDVMRSAHAVGLRSTATMMFGHVDAPQHWARHLLCIRDLQAETGGFTEFVPLPFVAAQTPLYRRGLARPGPTFREVLLVHAVARLALHPVLPNVQASWVKLGPQGAAACLRAGVNDLGGTLMNESITRAAGALHGQEMTPSSLRSIAASAGQQAWQRTTFYEPAPARVVARAAADEVLSSDSLCMPTIRLQADGLSHG